MAFHREQSWSGLEEADVASQVNPFGDDYALSPEEAAHGWPQRSPSYATVRQDEYELSSDPIHRQLPGSSNNTYIDTARTKLLLSKNDRDLIHERSWLPIWFKRYRRRFSGWRSGLLISSATTGIVFLLNLILTIWASQKYGIQSGYGILIAGDCEKTKRASTWIHFAINVLSTLLLSASNYCMQILTAPTRAEIDEAHTRGRWLDIGVPSVRNLRSISRKRVLLWFGLAFSSLPLHLLFNSAVFESLAANEYTVYVASHETGSSKANVTYAALGNQSVPTGFNALSESSQNGTLQRLDRRACLQSYGTYFLANRRDVVIVVNDTLDALVVNYGYGQPPSRATSTPYEWMCAGTDHWQKDCNPSYIVPTADTWSINWRELSGARPFDADPNNPVDYCLSQQVEAKCELQFNVSIMIIVIIANFAKFCCMLYTILTHRIPTIVTIGDAISSFLQRPDAATVDRCTLSRAGVVDQDKWMKWTWDTQTYQVVDSQPQNWDGKAYRWFHGASKTRRFVCYTLCIIALISAYVLLGSAIHGVANNGSSTSLPTLWAMGLGSVNPYALLSGGQSNNSDHLGVVGNILLANTAQVIISFLYFSYNSIFTCELLSREWTSYTQERKSLRVTSPTGIQRSTYFLQLPYTYALPLMVFSGLLHWLVSQSIFLAQVNYYNIDGTHDDSSSISNCGFSCIGIIFAIIVGSLLIMGSWANCFRRYPGGIPLATHCSAAISAACHPPKEDVDAAFKRVQYGEVESKNGVRHCTFTSFDVSTPIAGELYA